MKNIKFSHCLIIIVMASLLVLTCGKVYNTGDGAYDKPKSIDPNKSVFVKLSSSYVEDDSYWKDATDNVQDAIEFAAKQENNKTHVLIMAGTYKPTDRPNTITGGTAARQVHFSLRNNVTVIGGFVGNEVMLEPAGEATIFSGDLGGNDSTTGVKTDNVYHVFYHPALTGLDNTAILQNVTITGGYADVDGNGAGMYNYDSSPILIMCNFTKNSAPVRQYGRGGGMYNYEGNPKLVKCTFDENSVIIYAIATGWSGYSDYSSGGGIYNSRGNIELIDCTFTKNSVSSYATSSALACRSELKGGGLFNESGSVILTNCIFVENSVSATNIATDTSSSSSAIGDARAGASGGGMFDQIGNSKLTNCIFNSNSAISYSTAYYYSNAYTHGGGMAHVGGSPELLNCTFSNNSISSSATSSASDAVSYAYGSGLYNQGRTKLTSCTFTANDATASSASIAEAYGGGLYNQGANGSYLCDVTLYGNCVFNKNKVTGKTAHGGAIYNGIYTSLLGSIPVYGIDENANSPDDNYSITP